MQKYIAILLWVGLGFMAHASGTMTSNEALKLARQEQILVSRLLKDIVLIGSNFLHKNEAQKDKKESFELFTKNLQRLKGVDTSENWQIMMGRIEQQEKKIRTLVDLQPDSKQGMKYMRAFSKMKHLWNAPITYLAKKTGSRANNPAGVLSLYRTYVHQMPTLYLLRTWDLKNPAKIDQAMEQIEQQFRKSIWILQSSRKTTDATRKLLKKLQGILLYFDVMWDSDIYTPAVVIKKSKEAQSIIEQLMQIYTQ